MVSKHIIKIKEKVPNYVRQYLRFYFKLEKLHYISDQEFEDLRKLSIIRRLSM